MTCDACGKPAVGRWFCGLVEGWRNASFYVRLCVDCDVLACFQAVFKRGWVRP